jgi:hypothetical protein
VAALNQDQLATLLEGVDTYLRTTLMTLAAQGLTAFGRGFEIKMVLDPLVLCALATGLLKVPGFEEKAARKAWTRMLIMNKKDRVSGAESSSEGGRALTTLGTTGRGANRTRSGRVTPSPLTSVGP